MNSKVSRTKMSKRNVTASIVARLVGIITSFAGRYVFVKVLSAEYLGIGGFFGNIFSVLSLCDLGFGAAISQSLYKPLAEGDEYRVSAIVRYFAKIYRRAAFIMLFLGISALPILPRIVKTQIDMSIISASFLLLVIHNFFSYILAPKCALVVCDQRMYVTAIVRSVFGVAALVIQSVLLVVTRNYIFYLASRIAVLLIEDLIINGYADKKYPFLAFKINVDKKYKKRLYENVKALMFHKIGGVLSRSTDSLLLTYFVGLSGMGKYSNYALVIGSIGAFFDVAINSVSASVGNLGAGDRGEKSERIMRTMYFVNFWLITVGTCIIVCVLNPFIELWLGKDMLFTNTEMLVIVASFYFSCIRDPVQIFVSSYGLFRQSRFIPITRALCNLVLSVVFVQKIGVAGVFLGTTLSTVLIPLFGETAVLYKHGFSLKARDFYREMMSYIGISVLCTVICFVLTYNVKISLLGIVSRGISAFCASNALLLLLCSGNGYFAEMSKLLSKRITNPFRS